MTRSEWITVLVSVITLIVLPTLGLLIRITMRWTRTEDRLAALIDDVKELVEDKERVHEQMYRTMREDRERADKRISWLEQNLWRTGGRR